MKAHKRLMQSLNAIANPLSQKSRDWKLAHPVTCGLIPLVDYVPPSGHGRKIAIQFSKVETRNVTIKRKAVFATLDKLTADFNA